MYSGLTEHKLRHSNNRLVRMLTHRYATARNITFEKLAIILSFAFKLIPVRLAAMVKERLDLAVLMPYEKQIIIKVDSQREIRRSGFCFREQETLQWLEECSATGGTLYDIGANIGAVSLLYASNLIANKGILEERSVLSFEPLFSTYSRLCENIHANGWSGHILPFPFPLSDKVQADNFKIQSLQSGSSSHSIEGSEVNDFEYVFTQPVLTFTVDYMHFEMGFPAPRYMKIDVDGHDYNVLLGAEKIFEMGIVDSVLIEMNDRAQEIRRFMSKYGFEEVNIYRADIDNRNLRFDRKKSK